MLNGYVVPVPPPRRGTSSRQRGYATVERPPNATGNAPWDDQFHTTVFFNGARSRARAPPRSMARLFGAAEAVPFAPRRSAPARRCSSLAAAICGRSPNGAMLTVVVGQTFHNRLAPGRRAHPDHAHAAGRPPRPLGDRLARSRPEAEGRLPAHGALGARPSRRRPTRSCPCARTASTRTTAPCGSCSGAASSTGASSRRTGPTRPMLDSRSLHRVINGRGYDFYYRGRSST